MEDVFDDYLPVVGDKIVESLPDGADATEVTERYVYFGENGDSIWHLILKRVELPPDRLRAL